MNKIIQKWLGELNIFTAFLVSVLLISGIGTATYVLASPTSQFSQLIQIGSLSVDFVDGSGNSIGSPSVTMGALTFSFDTQDATGQLATATEKIRVSNPTQTAAWSVVIAATNPADTWDNAGNTKHFDFNDAGGYVDDGGTTDSDSYGGQMTINPTTGTISGVDGCSTDGTTKGSSASFVEVTANSITIMTSTTAATECRWEFTGAASNVTQKIPAKQSADTYTIDLTLTIS
jgi:hypothetical protein